MSSDPPHDHPSSSQSAAASNDVAKPEVIDEDEEVSISKKGYVSEEIGFRTPTAREQRIPRSSSCPPAPRKPRAVSTAHKRKLTFEDAAREEVEAFFERSKRRSFRNRSDVNATTTTNGNKMSGL
ncbi:unnamed protein product [Rhodiola kirilowii]